LGDCRNSKKNEKIADTLQLFIFAYNMAEDQFTADSKYFFAVDKTVNLK